MAEDTVIRYLFERKPHVFDDYANNNNSKNTDLCETVTLNIKRSSSDKRVKQRDTNVHNICVYIYRNKQRLYKKRRSYKIYEYLKNGTSLVKRKSKKHKLFKLTKHYSMLTLKGQKIESDNTKLFDTKIIESSKQFRPFIRNFIVNNCCQTCEQPQCTNPFLNPLVLARIYRCQLDAQHDTCCCSCNSDAMFEVMKSLYDCYKKKNCQNCKCILCGPMSAVAALKEAGMETEKKAIKEKVSSMTQITSTEKIEKAKAEGLLTPLEGKTSEEKERIIKELVKMGAPVPVLKTSAEKKIMSKVRADLGIPPEPKSTSDKVKYQKAVEEGIVTPLEGKTKSQKEQAIKKMLKAGISLPEGRTKSEKSLIEKVKSKHSAKSRKTKAISTTLEGKSSIEKERIIKELVKKGEPLPELKTVSDKKIMSKVRADIGLPPEPKTTSGRIKQQKAISEGIITPLEGKTPEQKEQIIKKMMDAGLPLPKARTSSEKALVSKIKAARSASKRTIKSEKLKKSKTEGLITPLEGKTPEEKEKALMKMAEAGIPLPKGRTASEQALIDKIKALLEGMQKPSTAAEGIITPLEGKTPEQQEQIIKKLMDAGLPLPEAQTASVKALVSKVKAARSASKRTIRSEKLKMAKTEGIITPLEGKTPEEKEKALMKMAQAGIPLPKGRTASEQALIDKIKALLEGMQKPSAAAEGIITPLEGKTPEQQEQIIKKLMDAGLPLPEAQTASVKALVSKIKAAKSASIKDVKSEKLKRAKAEGFMTPLEGKTQEEKEKVIKGLAKIGLPLPEPKTASEKKMMSKVRADLGIPPEPKSTSRKLKYQKAMTEGIITPLEGKTPEQKEQALMKMAEAGIPLPVGRTPSEQALIDKIKALLEGLKKSREIASVKLEKSKSTEAIEAPAEGKPSAKTKKASIKSKATTSVASEKLRKARAAGLLTPLSGKTSEQKQKILKSLVKIGVPLPEPKTDSDRRMISKVRVSLGLPPEPKSSTGKEKYKKAVEEGIISPLEGKSSAQKEQILRKMAEAGVMLPEGRTPSEKALIDTVKASAPPAIPSEKIKQAKAAGLLTPIEGKTPEQKEKIVKELAKIGMPLPIPKTDSDKKLIEKVRMDIGLPPEPVSSEEKIKYKRALTAGIISPLEGKTSAEKEQTLRSLAEAGVPLPAGRTPSEKTMIKSIKSIPPKPVLSEKIRKAKEEGLLTPLQGKTAEEKERIIKGLAKIGHPPPELKTASEKKIMSKIRVDLGLPPEPKSTSEKLRYQKALAEGIVTPLEGKTQEQKEQALLKMGKAGIPLPVGRTPSEQALIDKIKALLEGLTKSRAVLQGKSAVLTEAGVTPSEGKRPSEKTKRVSVKTKATISIFSEKLRKAKAAGLLTPLTGKTTEQKEKILKSLAKIGAPLPEPKTDSDKKVLEKVQKDLGLPPEPKSSTEKEKYRKAIAAGIISPLEGKTTAQKEEALRKMAEAGVTLPEGRTPSEKALIDTVRASTPAAIPSEKIRKAKAAGLLSTLEGKSLEQKDKIFRDLAKMGMPMPEPKSESEKQLTKKINKDLGLPPEPEKSDDKIKYRKALAAGLITPLEGKTSSQKEQALMKMAQAGLRMPEGRTASEQALIDKIRALLEMQKSRSIPPEKLEQAKAEGLLTPLEGKASGEKERILKGLAKIGAPLPELKSATDQKLMSKVRTNLGLPPEPSTLSGKIKYQKALAEGIITPLEGKTPEQKEQALMKMVQAGYFPVGRTPSEQALIDKIKALLEGLQKPRERPPEKSVTKGIITPLEGKTTEEKEQIIKKLIDAGLPLPESSTSSDKALASRIKTEKSASKRTMKSERLTKVKTGGIITPLEGKTSVEKEQILRKMVEAGLSLPEAKTSSERALISSIKASSPLKIPSEKMQKAKAEGLLTPLEGKSIEEKERILKGLAKLGAPLPKAKTASEKKIMSKVRIDLGIPSEPKSISGKSKYRKALAEGVITPLEGKTDSQKEQTIKKFVELGIPLPEGRTPSEKALIEKVKSSLPVALSEKIKKAKAEGLLSPLEGKTIEEKERIIRSLARTGIPLPEAKTASEKKIISKVHAELGLPPAPRSSTGKAKYQKALSEGIITPLEGKTLVQKEEVLKKMQLAGIRLPEGRTASEKDLIAKVKASVPSISSAKLKKATEAGLITPLEGKTYEEKETIIKGLAKVGLPLPEAKTESDKKLVQKVREDLGLPPPSKAEKLAAEKISKAKDAGLLTPLEGKSIQEKKRIVKSLIEAGLPLPEGKTSSEKQLIREIKKQVKRASIVGGRGEAVAHEIEEIVKTTKCDRACGCDRKKIRFKHSYVKIRVTSPDISSFCDCPDECLPGVKEGIFVDNEGIKVTIGRVTGIPLFDRASLKRDVQLNTSDTHELGDKVRSKCWNDFKNQIFNDSDDTDKLKAQSCCFDTQSKENNVCQEVQKADSFDCNICKHDEPTSHLFRNTQVISSEPKKASVIRISKYTICRSAEKLKINSEKNKLYYTNPAHVSSSCDSIFVMETESSLGLAPSPQGSELSTMSNVTFLDSNFSSTFEEEYNNTYYNPVVESGCLESALDHYAVEPITCDDSKDQIDLYKDSQVFKKETEIEGDFIILRFSDNNYQDVQEMEEPQIVLNQLNDDHTDIYTAVTNILSNNPLSTNSSVYVLVASTDVEDSSSEDSQDLILFSDESDRDLSIESTTSITQVLVAPKLNINTFLKWKKKMKIGKAKTKNKEELSKPADISEKPEVIKKKTESNEPKEASDSEPNATGNEEQPNDDVVNKTSNTSVIHCGVKTKKHKEICVPKSKESNDVVNKTSNASVIHCGVKTKKHKEICIPKSKESQQAKTKKEKVIDDKVTEDQMKVENRDPCAYSEPVGTAVISVNSSPIIVQKKDSKVLTPENFLKVTSELIDRQDELISKAAEANVMNECGDNCDEDACPDYSYPKDACPDYAYADADGVNVEHTCEEFPLLNMYGYDEPNECVNKICQVEEDFSQSVSVGNYSEEGRWTPPQVKGREKKCKICGRPREQRCKICGRTRTPKPKGASPKCSNRKAPSPPRSAGKLTPCPVCRKRLQEGMSTPCKMCEDSQPGSPQGVRSPKRGRCPPRGPPCAQSPGGPSPPCAQMSPRGQSPPRGRSPPRGPCPTCKRSPPRTPPQNFTKGTSPCRSPPGSPPGSGRVCPTCRQPRGAGRQQPPDSGRHSPCLNRMPRSPPTAATQLPCPTCGKRTPPCTRPAPQRRAVGTAPLPCPKCGKRTPPGGSPRGTPPRSPCGPTPQRGAIGAGPLPCPVCGQRSPSTPPRRAVAIGQSPMCSPRCTPPGNPVGRPIPGGPGSCSDSNLNSQTSSGPFPSYMPSSLSDETCRVMRRLQELMEKLRTCPPGCNTNQPLYSPLKTQGIQANPPRPILRKPQNRPLQTSQNHAPPYQAANRSPHCPNLATPCPTKRKPLTPPRTPYPTMSSPRPTGHPDEKTTLRRIFSFKSFTNKGQKSPKDIQKKSENPVSPNAAPQSEKKCECSEVERKSGSSCNCRPFPTQSKAGTDICLGKDCPSGANLEPVPPAAAPGFKIRVKTCGRPMCDTDTAVTPEGAVDFGDAIAGQSPGVSPKNSCCTPNVATKQRPQVLTRIPPLAPERQCTHNHKHKLVYERDCGTVGVALTPGYPTTDTESISSLMESMQDTIKLMNNLAQSCSGSIDCECPGLDPVIKLATQKKMDPSKVSHVECNPPCKSRTKFTDEEDSDGFNIKDLLNPNRKKKKEKKQLLEPKEQPCGCKLQPTASELAIAANTKKGKGDMKLKSGPPPCCTGDNTDKECECDLLARKEDVQKKSEQSQTKSGFNFIKIAKPVEVDMTFEEALDYFDKEEKYGSYLTYLQKRKLKKNKKNTRTVKLSYKLKGSSCDVCEDTDCTGLGPGPNIPKIENKPQQPALSVAQLNSLHLTHAACSCEPMSKFEEETSCKNPEACPDFVPVTDQIYCECKKSNKKKVPNICECPWESKRELADAKDLAAANAACKSESDPKIRRVLPPGAAYGSGFRGFNFSIPGHGSKAKGIRGVCCFDVFEDYTEKNTELSTSGAESSESDTFIIYS